jgi:transcriptional/translational regulatory protein YebC/TACO1
VIVEALTDNRNRAPPTSAPSSPSPAAISVKPARFAFMFDRTGIIEYDASKASDDAMLDAAIEAGADDVISSEAATRSTPRRKPFARLPRRWKRNSARPARRR